MFLPGDLLIADRRAYKLSEPKIGDVVLARPSGLGGRTVVKRVCDIPSAGAYTLLGDALTESTDSRDFGSISRDGIAAKVCMRLWPPVRHTAKSPSFFVIASYLIAFACGVLSAKMVFAQGPDAFDVQDAIQEHVMETIESEGAFFVDDELTDQVRELQWIEIHSTGERDGHPWGRAKMLDVASEDLVEVEFDLEPFEEKYEVVDVRVLGASLQDKTPRLESAP